MVLPELGQLQQALSHKADSVQREFVALSEELHLLGRRLIETRGEGTEPFVTEQAALVERQQVLAAEVNLWRDRTRAVQRQPSEDALRAYLAELAAAGDATVTQAVEALLHALDHPEEAGARAQAARGPTTPGGRLLERARTEFDLRASDPAPRQRAAVEFANRPGQAQSDESLAEIEAALDDADLFVKEVAVLTAIQMHRFRAMRLGDLDAAHASVRRLARLKHPAVVPALLEILETPRTGYVGGAAGMQDGDNQRSRLVALAGLMEWRSPLVQSAMRRRQQDRDSLIAEAATRALEVFPGEWK
jgi:hypothetical protein